LITRGTVAFGKYESMQQTERELLEFLGGVEPGQAVYFGSSLSFHKSRKSISTPS